MNLWKKAFRPFYDNAIEPLVPELWANESILILEEEMVYGNLVHRDFSPIVANFGETIHTRKPSEFTALRKTNADPVVTQDVSAADIEVKLDQWVHVSFVIKDGEQTKAFKDLVRLYLHPAMLANARILDQVLAGQVVKFLGNSVGGLGQISGSNSKDYLIDAREKLNTQKAYADGRNLVLGANSEAELLRTDLFISAERVGDGGRALREASLGRKFGLNTFMDLNVPGVKNAATDTPTTTTAAAAVGAASVAITAAVGKGRYATIAGENTPMRGTTNTTTFTPTRPFVNGSASGAVVTPVKAGAVNAAAGFGVGYSKKIRVDGAGTPRVGQIVAFNSGDTATGTLLASEYVIVSVTALGGSDYDIMLDRPLEAALADNDAVCYGPNGELNFAFHRNALALVNRPLALPMSGTGARAAVTSYNGLSMRVVITYDGVNQGHRVTLDSLFGVKDLDLALGCVLLG